MTAESQMMLVDGCYGYPRLMIVINLKIVVY